MRLAIVGLGPIGLEMAVAALEAGWQVTGIERGRIASNVRRWGHVRFFSPWAMNVSTRGLGVLKERGLAAPDPDTFPTGEEYVARYLRPLAEWVAERATLHEETEVQRIGRGRLLKKDEIGTVARRAAPFRLLLLDAAGEESFLEADLVVDASGTYGNPNHLGPGGLPARGERAFAHRIAYVIPDVLGVDRAAYEGRRTMVIGAGYSAITTIALLLELAKFSPGTELVWVTRRASTLYEPIADDPLPERARLAQLGNELSAGDAEVVFVGESHVESIDEATEGRVGVTLVLADGTERREVVDRVIANVGYRPDVDLYRELQVHQCYASEGPMKLAAALLGADSADCLAQPTTGDETLANPEPGFFIVGSKSYGRNSRFLLRVGLDQIEQVLRSARARAAG